MRGRNENEKVRWNESERDIKENRKGKRKRKPTGKGTA